MKRLASIALLSLLLYHMFSGSVALLCFEDDFRAESQQTNEHLLEYKMPISLPYTSDFAREGSNDLVEVNGQFYNVVAQNYEGDTLSVKLKSNSNARETFFALAQEFSDVADAQAQKPMNPAKQVLKLFKSSSADYLPSTKLALEWGEKFEFYASKEVYNYLLCLPEPVYKTLSPPPKA